MIIACLCGGVAETVVAGSLAATITYLWNHWRMYMTIVEIPSWEGGTYTD